MPKSCSFSFIVVLLPLLAGDEARGQQVIVSLWPATQKAIRAGARKQLGGHLLNGSLEASQMRAGRPFGTLAPLEIELRGAKLGNQWWRFL